MARPSTVLRRLRRSVAARWVLVAAAAVAVAVEARHLTAEAEAERDAWGTPVAVVVAARDVAGGDVIGAADVRVEQRPAAVVPDGALADAPIGQLATAALIAGEVVVDTRVSPDGLSAVAALVPDGWRAVAVATSTSGLGAPAPPLAVGDRVDLLAPDAVAEGAVVVAVADGAVTVAVPAADVDDVAAATSAAVVTIALRGPSG